MKSPFPGMDPYIEASGRWEDFHAKFIAEIERTLSPLLPERYGMSLGERSYIVVANANGKDENPFLPDIGVHTPSESAPPTPQGGSTAIAEPVTDAEALPIRAFVATEFRETFIEIYDLLDEQRLVTCLEVLSPSNKRRGTPGWELYQRKRQALLLGQANFIEIDFVREGRRLPMIDAWPESPYAVLVVRYHVGSVVCEVVQVSIR